MYTKEVGWINIYELVFIRLLTSVMPIYTDNYKPSDGVKHFLPPYTQKKKKKKRNTGTTPPFQKMTPQLLAKYLESH